MRPRTASLGILLVLIVGCSGPRGPVPPPPQPRPAAAPLLTPSPSAPLPLTWTPGPLVTLPPPATIVPATASATPLLPSPTATYWAVDAIPAVTLTPTPARAVPPAAERMLADAHRAIEDDDLERALQLLDEGLELVPDHAGFFSTRGQVLVALMHPLDAESDLRRALGLDPFQQDARRTLAGLYAQYGRWRDAAAEYTRYLTLAPDHAAAWYALGQIREQQGRPTEATAAYSAALELDPDHLDALTRRATLWLQAEDYEAAWTDYTALIGLQPSAELYQARGDLDLRLGAPLAAAADFEEALSLQPAGVPTLTLVMQIGQAYLQGEAPDRAVPALTTAISLTAALEPRIWLGESHLATGNYTAALHIYSSTVQLATPPELGQVLAGRGRAHLGLGNYDEAAADLEEALNYARSGPEQAAILEWRSASYAALERYQEAIIDLTAAYRLTSSPAYLYHRGTVYQATGNHRAAIADLTDFLDTADPNGPDPLLIADAETRLEELTAEPP